MTDDIWVTRDGEEIPVKDMTDDHLMNALSWCRRNQDRIHAEAMAVEEFAASCRGEMATYHAEQAAQDAASRTVYFEESYHMLKREAKRRWKK